MHQIYNLLSKIPTEKLVFIGFLGGIILIFLPTDIALNLKIETFTTEYKTYISLFVIASLCYYLYQFISFVYQTFVFEFIYSLNIKKYLSKNITRDERELLIRNFYDFESKMFRLKAELEISDGVVSALIRKGILVQTSSISVGWTIFSLILNNVALKQLNLMIKNGEIEINKNSYIWPSR